MTRDKEIRFEINIEASGKVTAFPDEGTAIEDTINHALMSLTDIFEVDVQAVSVRPLEKTPEDD